MGPCTETCVWVNCTIRLCLSGFTVRFFDIVVQISQQHKVKKSLLGYDNMFETVLPGHMVVCEKTS